MTTSEELHRVVQGKRMIHFKEKAWTNTKPIYLSLIRYPDYLLMKERLIMDETVLAVFEGVKDAVVCWVELEQ